MRGQEFHKAFFLKLAIVFCLAIPCLASAGAPFADWPVKPGLWRIDSLIDGKPAGSAESCVEAGSPDAAAPLPEGFSCSFKVKGRSSSSLALTADCAAMGAKAYADIKYQGDPNSRYSVSMLLKLDDGGRSFAQKIESEVRRIGECRK